MLHGEFLLLHAENNNGAIVRSETLETLCTLVSIVDPRRGLLCRQGNKGAMASRSHILVVEDDPLVGEVVVDALEGIYQTSRAETSAAALDRLRAGGIDAMLLDCTLPGGLDPHLVPMADRSGVPVILMSGHPDMVDCLPGLRRPFIQKPFSLNALLAAIEQAMPG
jgi:DNA-binding NtrC family response regulator